MLDSTECAARRAAIVEYVAGALAEGERPQIAAHLAGCAACQSEATLWRATLAALEDADAAPPDTGAAAGWQALRERLGAHSALGEVEFAGRATESGVSPTIPETTGARAPVAMDGRRPVWPTMLPRLVAAALLLALLGAGVYAAIRGQAQSTQVHIDQIKLTYASTGQLMVPEPLTTPDGLSIQLLAIERQPSRWLFAFAVTNQTDHALDVLRTGGDHRFVLVGAKPAGTPADQGEVSLVRPATSELAAHPVLPAALPAGAMVQGWLAADTTALGYPPQLLLYRYATVHTTRCANPQAWWTCWPADLYSALEWDL